MRIRLLIDVETDRLDLLQQFVREEPTVKMTFEGRDGPGQWQPVGRFVGAKEAHGPSE